MINATKVGVGCPYNVPNTVWDRGRIAGFPFGSNTLLVRKFEMLCNSYLRGLIRGGSSLNI